jgi:hypothetical protein
MLNKKRIRPTSLANISQAALLGCYVKSFITIKQMSRLPQRRSKTPGQAPGRRAGVELIEQLSGSARRDRIEAKIRRRQQPYIIAQNLADTE